MNVNGQSSRVHAYMNNGIARNLTMECAQLNNGAHAGLHLNMYHNHVFNFLIFMLSVSDLEFPILYKT